MLKLPLVYVAMALALIADVCNAGLTPPLDASDADEFVRQNSRRMLDSEAPVTKKELATEDNCSDFNDSCQGCLQRHCVFVVYQPYETKCMDGKLTLADLNREDPDKSISSFILNAAQCPPEANAINSQLRQVSLSDETTTTTDTTPSTTSNSTTSSTTTTTTSLQPSTTNSTTASSTSTSSVTPATTSTTESSTVMTSSTSASSTSSQAPILSTSTTESPDSRQGSKFDGWSFFGGILLTVGISAIGFVSFKYYKVRSGGGAGTNYNRF